MQLRTLKTGRPQLRKSEDGPTMLIGRAVVYDSWSDLIWGHFRERFVPGSLTDSLKSGHDIICSIDHDETKLLARTSSGTLKLTETEQGVDVALPMPDVSYARDLIELINRGDVTGMSFIFDGLEDTWARGSDGVPERTVVKAEIYEVSFVGQPAYPATIAGLRSIPHGVPIEIEQQVYRRMYEGLIKVEHELMRARLDLLSKV
jgi:HK97 family phage prohead protease